jgi:hypothetical protein
MVKLPAVYPLGWEIDSSEMIKELWDFFQDIRNDGGVPSIEDRMMHAVLRSFYEALLEHEGSNPTTSA